MVVIALIGLLLGLVAVAVGRQTGPGASPGRARISSSRCCWSPAGP
jgi:hypothetical protein